jgi:hypothetical protein
MFTVTPVPQGRILRRCSGASVRVSWERMFVAKGIKRPPEQIIEALRRRGDGASTYEIARALDLPQTTVAYRDQLRSRLSARDCRRPRRHRRRYPRVSAHQSRRGRRGRCSEYPRYQFSNRSEDIRRLFTQTCDQVGVEGRRWGRWHISVARRDSVAKLDRMVGPKR